MLTVLPVALLAPLGCDGDGRNLAADAAVVDGAVAADAAVTGRTFEHRLAAPGECPNDPLFNWVPSLDLCADGRAFMRVTYIVNGGTFTQDAAIILTRWEPGDVPSAINFTLSADGAEVTGDWQDWTWTLNPAPAFSNPCRRIFHPRRWQRAARSDPSAGSTACRAVLRARRDVRGDLGVGDLELVEIVRRQLHLAHRTLVRRGVHVVGGRPHHERAAGDLAHRRRIEIRLGGVVGAAVALGNRPFGRRVGDDRDRGRTRLAVLRWRPRLVCLVPAPHGERRLTFIAATAPTSATGTWRGYRAQLHRAA